jgi:uncharacterized DUF497 family protein
MHCDTIRAERRGSVVRIRSLDWRPDRVEHIAKHDVEPYEVEGALGDRRGLIIKAGPAERNPGEIVYRVYGRTETGRYLFVALLLYEDGEEALPLTAREMTDKEKRRYAR